MKTIDKIKADPRVREVFAEEGNLESDKLDWWVYLKTGWQSDPETHVIHEQTLTACLRQLKLVEPCYCEECEINRESES